MSEHENKPNKPSTNTYSQDDLLNRLHRTFGPLAGGVILDAADLITMGPIGIFGGMIVGSAVGWWVSSIYQYSKQSRLIWAAISGIYCMMPFTAVLPLATIVSAVGRFRPRENDSKVIESSASEVSTSAAKTP